MCEGGGCLGKMNSKIPCFSPVSIAKVMGYRYRSHGGMCLYPKAATDTATCAQEIFQAMNDSHLQELAFYGNFNNMGGSWFDAMKEWLSG
eukprot:m.106186 g.106186  ORF g.106186 m.106186 type:complete len:90 (+) comp22527_c3_seq3:79-348(+)